jgi:excisionase family DNA binding protein
MNEQATPAIPGPVLPGHELEFVQEFWITDQLTPDVHHESFRVSEVARLLGISADRIRHAVQTGELAAERVGHAIVRIHRADLLAWLNTQGPGI